MGWRLAIVPAVALGVTLSPGRAAAQAGPPPARGAAAAPSIAGTYRLAAVVRVDPGTLPSTETEERGDAIVEPGAAGAVRVRLAARGQRCALEAKLAASGELAFAPGQRCRAVLDDEDAKGTVDATLAAGSGRARDGLLELDLVFRLEGRVRVRHGSLDLLGTVLGAPELSADVPVSGEARARAEGRRDESRAAGR